MARPGIEPSISDLRVRCIPTALRGPALNEANLSAWYDFKSKPGKKSTGSIKVYYKYQKIIQTLHKTLTGVRASYLFGL